MEKKEFLLAISELKIYEKLGKMNEEQLDEYLGALNSFIEEFSTDKKTPQDGQKGGKGGKCILAVDDREFILRNLKLILQDTDYKLTATTSGKTALEFLRKNHPDLFILDIEMSEMSGYELAAKIREIGQKAPIIFLTGSSTKESVEKALKAGASDFITKPISKAQILERIAKFI